jgi:hypothetical protein
MTKYFQNSFSETKQSKIAVRECMEWDKWQQQNSVGGRTPVWNTHILLHILLAILYTPLEFMFIYSPHKSTADRANEQYRYYILESHKLHHNEIFLGDQLH